eukprot:CAMPEP_0172573116 /NCGR_PEP_ID=MMETSP1067-20121228/136028_1 /TAXON_ID=265564 ORGANISM="Thalassiosira punctigera, Strain Tpunct2005C2" /NCGR_SAMPLE_ID=MMETSP1067 /ASSEMBLY_ACC=CAM_ASM_000444 /LENGTH=231 /DNA_ID=CAMNT_0013365713 /DNA_START=2209 /DNA_END=2906 /DNA_ORIENTATION=-
MQTLITLTAPPDCCKSKKSFPPRHLQLGSHAKISSILVTDALLIEHGFHVLISVVPPCCAQFDVRARVISPRLIFLGEDRPIRVEAFEQSDVASLSDVSLEGVRGNAAQFLETSQRRSLPAKEGSEAAEDVVVLDVESRALSTSRHWELSSAINDDDDDCDESPSMLSAASWLGGMNMFAFFLFLHQATSSVCSTSFAFPVFSSFDLGIGLAFTVIIPPPSRRAAIHGPLE